MRTYFTLLTTLFLFFSQFASASVVMTGTRIIYSAQAREKTVHLRNTAQQPYIVQVQTDDGKRRDAIEADDNFIITPPIFRMEPNAGQSIRLIYNGKSLPEDRESLFYMSFTQLPVSKVSQQSSNQLVLAITNRVKIFYRPAGLAKQQKDPAQLLSFSLNGKKINVTNPGGYFAVVRRASLLTQNGEIVLADSAMVSPKSSAEWTPSSPVHNLKGMRLRLVLVNDYGMDTVTERLL